MTERSSLAPQELTANAHELWMGALETLRGAMSDKTIAEYASCFRRFLDWCAGAGRAALPAEPATVAAFVDVCSTRCASCTVFVYIHAIRRVHTGLGLPDPTQAGEVLMARRRGARLRPQGPRQALGISLEMRQRLLAACRPGLQGLRDRAMISLGFDTLCRRSELVALRIEDLAPGRAGTACILVRRSKSDPYGAGAWAYLSAAGFADVRIWLDAAGLESGPVLRRLWKCRAGEGPLSPQTVTKRLRAVAADAQVPEPVIARLSSHSLRIGAVQELAASGRSILEMMRAGRWRSLDALATYLREAPLNVWSGEAADD